MIKNKNPSRVKDIIFHIRVDKVYEDNLMDAPTPANDRRTKTVFLAAPRGFCAGVDRAIQIVERTLEKYGSPVYVRHEIPSQSNGESMTFVG